MILNGKTNIYIISYFAKKNTTAATISQKSKSITKISICGQNDLFKTIFLIQAKKVKKSPFVPNSLNHRFAVKS
jgi:hypothetical protein